MQQLEPYKYPARFTGLWFLERLFYAFPVRLMPRFLSEHRRKFVARCFVMARDITALQAPPIPDGIEFLVLGDDDIDRIASHEEARNQLDYRERVKNGDICYGLKKAGEIVSYNWIRFNKCCVFCSYPWEIDFLDLDEDQAFTYDFYTYKKFRRAGFGTLLKKLLLAHLRDSGIREIFSIVYRHNFSSLRIHLALGYEARHLFNGYQLLDGTGYTLVATDKNADLKRWIKEFSRDVLPLEQSQNA